MITLTKKVLEVKKLRKSFGSLVAVNNVSFSINEGEIVALLGPNGCGKTTLMKSILGFTGVNSGSIYLFDKLVVEKGKTKNNVLTVARRKIGYIPDQNMFYDHLSCFEYLNLIFNLTIPDYPGKKTDSIEIIRTILKDYRLDRWSNRLIHTLSTGTKQKLAFAACLVHKPELLIMDEPFRGIDPEAHLKFINSLVDFRTKGITLFGIEKPGTIFMSSHVLADIEKICDHLIVMNEYGQVVLVGEMNQVKETLLGDKKFEELLYIILHEKDEEEGKNQELSNEDDLFADEELEV